MATWRRLFAVLLLLALGAGGLAALATQPAFAQEQGRVPGETLGNTSDPEFWRAIRQGDPGTVSAPNPAAGVLIQSEGDNWRAVRNGPLSTYGVWGLIGVIALLALFFALRGRDPDRARPQRRDRHPLQLRRPLRPLADRDLLRGPGADRAQHALRALRAAPADRRRGVLLADHRRQVRARLHRLRLHARPRADVRPLGRPQLPQPARSGLARQGRRHVQARRARAGEEVQRRPEDHLLAGDPGRHLGQPVGRHAAVAVPASRCSARPSPG